MEQQLIQNKNDLSYLDIMKSWKYPCFFDDSKYSDEDVNLVISQRSLLGLLYFRNMRSEVVHNDKSMLAIVSGSHRSTKSTTAVLLSCMIDKTFWNFFESRIVQSPREFIDAVKTADKEGVHGFCIVVDEAGISMGSDSWYEKWARALEKVVMSFGYLNPIIWFCLPQAGFLDSKLRKMAHFYIKMKRYSKTESVMFIYEMEFNHILQDYIYRKPRCNLLGQRITIEKIIMSRPPEEILDRYKKLEQWRKGDIINRLSKDITKDDIMEKKEEADLKLIVEDICKNYKKFITGDRKDGRVIIDAIIVKHHYTLKSEDSHIVSRNASRIINERLLEERIKEERTNLDKIRTTEEDAEETEENQLTIISNERKQQASIRNKMKKKLRYVPSINPTMDIKEKQSEGKFE